MEINLYNPSSKSFYISDNQSYSIKLRSISSKDILLALLIILAISKSWNTTEYPTLNNNQTINHSTLLINQYNQRAGIFDYTITKSPKKNSRKSFLEYKQLFISKNLIENGISSLCFLKENQVLPIHQEIASKYHKHLVESKNLSKSELEFLNKELIEAALLMQHKYQIPASVLLSKAITLSNWGKSVYENNLFHIVEHNDLISYENTSKSIEDFSKRLSDDVQYASLFVGGKDYKSWTKRMGTIVCNDSIFSATQICYNKMEDTISQYHLDLLDY